MASYSSSGSSRAQQRLYQQEDTSPKPTPSATPSTYESILNSTLLFFVEKLIERSPRTLHDLSCQFGSPTFSREMRAVAGNSQAGLKKFLQSHPYLFTLNSSDDTVTYTPTTVADKLDPSDAKRAQLDKDTLKAIEYFQKRLLQYGPSVHVPIKSLQGHRSQAPLVIRHIVGQQLDQFINFLKCHESVFAVEDEFVWLVSEEGGGNAEFKELECEQVDTERVTRLIKYVQNTIENHGPMLVEQLFHRIAVQFESDQLMTPNDLATFLRMQNVFQVNSNLVTLTMTLPQVQPSKIADTKPSNHTGANQKLTPKFNLGESKPKPASDSTKHVPVVENNPASFHKPPRKLNVNNIILQTINSNATETLDNMVVVTNIRKGRQVAQNHLIASEALGLDCEGVNLGPEGQITLIQIGTPSSIYIFDMLVEGMSELLQPVIESESIVKVMHDCRNDSVNLHNQYGINLTNVFDTQVAYMVTKSKTKNISLNALCSELNLEGNTLKDKVKSIYRYDPKYWLRRPLTKQMLNYASSDVTSLLLIYAELLPLIQDKSTFYDLCLEQINVLILPNEIKQKKRLRKNQHDLVLLKKKFDEGDPSGLVLTNREIRLIKHLELPSHIIQQLPMRIYKKLTNQRQSGGSETNSLETMDSLTSSTTADFSLENQNHSYTDVSNLSALHYDSTIVEKTTSEIGTQTISTGDIVLTSIYYDDNQSKCFK